MKKLVLFFIPIFISINLFGQTKTQNFIDLSVGFNKDFFSTTFSANRLHSLGTNGKLSLGYGLRYTGAFSGSKNFITAPAKITEGNFFKKQNEAKLDTLTLTKSQINTINACINIAYNFNTKLMVGFNIDAIGFTFGGDQFGTLQSNGIITAENAKVTPFNLLLTGDYDNGSLNSELYVSYKVTPKIGIRAGLSFLYSEYTTLRVITSNFNNDRFRGKNLYPMLALSYYL